MASEPGTAHKRSGAWSNLPDLAAALILAVLPLITFWRVWASNALDRVMFGGDILMGAYPTRVYLHSLFDQAALPLWNPFQLAGMPMLGDVQNAPFYVPNMLLDALYRGRELPYLAFEMLVVAHYVLGALFLYGYLRRLGVRAGAALVGAVAFEFNGFFIGHRGHYNMLAVVVWLPGILWLLDLAWHAGRPRTALAWAVLAGLALGQMVMAGHPQVTLYCALTILAYGAFRWLESLRHASRWRQRLRLPLLFTLAGTLGAGVAAVALLPAAELIGRSLRNAPSFDFAIQYSLLPRNLIGLLVPEFLGWSATEFRIYAGILTLVLAAVAWLIPDRARPERVFFGLAFVAALLIALGGFTPLEGLIYRFVPGFASVRVSSRAFYVANLALAVFAAFGTEGMLAALSSAEGGRLRQLARVATALLGGAMLLGVPLYIALLNNYKPVGEDFFFADNLFRQTPSDDPFTLLTQTANAYLQFVLLFAGATLFLWVRLKSRLSGRGLAALAALLMFFDVATYAPYHDTIKADPDTAHFTVRQYAVKLLDAPWQVAEQQQIIDLLARMPDGVRADNAAEVLPDNYSTVNRTAFATGYNVLDIQQRFELLTQWPNLPASTRWDLLNVGYVLQASDAKDPPEPGALLLAANSQGRLWQRATQPNYARFSTSMRPATTSRTINGLLSAGEPIDAKPAVAIDGGRLADVLALRWPAATEPSLYQIGQTGVRSPVDISVLAGGTLKYSAVMIDGVTVSPQQRGIVLALVNPRDGTIRTVGGFDTYASTDESDRLAAVIAAAPDGTIAALATYDEGTARLTSAARAALASVGARMDLTDKAGAAYALIGVKGAQPGSALERLDLKAAVVADVGVGALPAQAGTKFTSQLVTYQADRITLLAGNSARGLLAISEAAYPGWEAYVDGVQQPILRANGMQRAVVLAPSVDGRPHEVTFVYRPASGQLGGAIAIVTLAVAVGILLAVAMDAILERRAHGVLKAPDSR